MTRSVRGLNARESITCSQAPRTKLARAILAASHQRNSTVGSRRRRFVTTGHRLHRSVPDDAGISAIIICGRQNGTGELKSCRLYQVGSTAEIAGNFCPCLIERPPYHLEGFRPERCAINELTGSHVGARNMPRLTAPATKLERHRGVTMAEPAGKRCTAGFQSDQMWKVTPAATSAVGSTPVGAGGLSSTTGCAACGQGSLSGRRPIGDGITATKPSR
jgi:hypothetical protein